MGTLTIRDVKTTVVRRLKAKAKANHRSLEAEARDILDRQAALPTKAEWLAEAERLRTEVTPWKPGMPTAVELVRQGRDEDR
jgi:plasmid stability protein